MDDQDKEEIYFLDEPPTLDDMFAKLLKEIDKTIQMIEEEDE